MGNIDPWLLGGVIVYLVLILSVIGNAARASGSTAEYYLGGRRMNSLVVALSAVATGRSAWVVLGVSGLAFTQGVSAVWSLPGAALMELFLLLFLAPRLRRFTQRRGNLTIPDYFESRFGGRRSGLRLLAVAVILLFMIAYISAQFAAGGKATSVVFGIQEDTGMLLMAGIVLLYTMIGGFVATSRTDAIQAFFMIFGLTTLPIVVIAQNGWAPVVDTLSALDPTLVDPISLGVGALIGALGIGLGSAGQPQILVRYMSISDPDKLRQSAVWSTLASLLMYWGALFIGLTGRAVYQEADTFPAADAEQVFPTMVGDYLPPFVMGVVVAALLAAIMSSVDSQLLVGSSAVVRDVYQRFFNKESNETDSRSGRYMVKLGRAVVLLLVLMGIGLLYLPGGSDLIFWLALFAWAGLGAAFGPALILSIFWRRTTAQGVAAGILVGTVTVVIWYYTPALKDAMYELVPAFTLSGLAVCFVRLLTRAPDNADHIMNDMKHASHKSQRSAQLTGGSS